MPFGVRQFGTPETFATFYFTSPNSINDSVAVLAAFAEIGVVFCCYVAAFGVFDIMDLPLLVTVNGERLAVIGRNFNLFERFLLKNLCIPNFYSTFAPQKFKQ